MTNEGLISREELKKAISILKPDGQLFEVRILQGKKILSGYFKSFDSLEKALQSVDLRNTNVYLTLGFINEDCYSRTQCERFRVGVTTTADSDITGYQWLLIDFDPERTTGVSSTDAELKASANVAKSVYEYLRGIGFEEPVKAKSGNGFHLLYRISLQNNSENTELLRRCLEVLSDMFSNEKVKVDTVNYNPSRICKLYGTLAQKGASTESRPHRMSRIFSDSANIKITEKEYLQKLANEIQPREEPKAKSYSSVAEFNLEDFLRSNGLTYRENLGSGRDGSIIYNLDECPFDSSHRDGDAKIFKYADGRISFKCHHNSCSRYRWQDVRLKFDPSAYDKTDLDLKYEIGWQQHNRDKQAETFQMQSEELNPEEMWRTVSDILKADEPNHEFIKSGIVEFDKITRGFEKQSITMISGLRGSGKSTLLGNIMLNAINDEHTVVCYSGELANKKYLNWLIRQAAGKNNVEVSVNYENGFGITSETETKIADWMEGKFWLYNNRYGNNFKKIAENLRKTLLEKRADLCVVDNLMALDLSNLDQDKYEAQTKFVWELKEIAQVTNTHIVFVAHPRKTNFLIRLEDVSGTGNIPNIIDNALMVHRVNKDFAKRYKDTFGGTPADSKIEDDATNVVEIAKDRENGTMDFFINLYYEPESKRLKNSQTENVLYNWDDNPPEVFKEEPQSKEWEELPF